MDLSVLNANESNGIAHNEYCVVSPASALSLNIPPLGIIAITDPSLLIASTVYVRCLSSDVLPSDSIILPSWLQQSLGKIPKIHVKGLDKSEPLGIISELVVTPLDTYSSTKCQISTWLSQTNISNTQHVRSRASRLWIETSIRRKVEGQIASTGSLIYATVKAQPHVFKILNLKFDRQEDYNMGLIDENTTLRIENVSFPMKTGPVNYGGINKIVQDISKIVDITVDSFSQSDAYTRLGIPNEKSIIITGVAGSGKKTIVR
ncbi:hypothetical protein BGZ76_010698 [Entomortierella beljakovae]|nr:hypothetical protein BGZ76_010698 [Entomortierella beljakovae]